MRKFFSFRSSSSSNANRNPTPTAPVSSRKVNSYQETPCQNGAKIPVVEKIQDGSQMLKYSAFKPVNQHQESDISSCSLHRRSLSFSSAIQSGTGEGNMCYLSNLSRSPSSCGSSPCHVTECHARCNPQNAEGCTTPKRGGRSAVRHLHAVEKLDSPCSSKGCQCLSGNSPYKSPIPLRCRAACLTQVLDKNKILDHYVDGEHQDVKSQKDSQNHFPDTENDCCPAKNKAFPCSGRPPRAQCTAPSSPSYSKENLRTYSFREVKDIRRHLSARDWKRDDLVPASPQRHTKKTPENPLHAWHERSMMKSQDYDSETITTIEDIYEDSSEHSNDIDHHCSTDCSRPYENFNDYCNEESLGFQSPNCFLKNVSMDNKNDKFTSPVLLEWDIGQELLKKVKEVEQIVMLLSEEDLELEELQNCSLNAPALLQTIRNISENRKSLAVELLSQIKFRLAERSDAKEGLKQAKLEQDIRTRRLEKEKIELQSSLEKELDRRSSDWSLKLEKFLSDEQRLRERVRELAEQNVSLQREISSLKGFEVDTRNQILNSEMQVNDLTASLEQARTENHDLHQALSQLQERLNGAEEDQEFIRRSYKEKERENKELQKVVVQLQRVCTEQDKTINGLRQGFTDEIAKQSIERGDHERMLQMEILRLTGVEQNLRKEVETLRHELESLRHENMGLLNRLHATGNGYGFSAVKLDQELCAQVDFLQHKGLSLLHDFDQLTGELLSFINCQKKCEHDQEANNDFDGYPFADYTMKYQSLRRGRENFRRSMQTIAAILVDKSSSRALDCQLETTEHVGSQHSKDQLEHELMAETMLTRVLREKLCSKELEIDQLKADLASSIMVHDVLQTEIQRLQDELSGLTHKMKDTELQMLKKDESIKQLQHDLQECTKELTATHNILRKVSEERDHMWEEVKRSREAVMLLNHEVLSLKKKIEKLEEDVLTKEGQIAILKDSLGDRPFDIICSPRSVKEFSLE
ncbi:MAR-binding filament-like protein 1 [Phoenix dactylifera]|uniref:MAR-binding filament-like protein 1 n=1 Tax=Phoenix dactylifera TaxID=42345 RepID=A0A8B7MUC3_PHODC|nr:MAR-binding filament-like protein 1 [Phoenix dactylifera]XP_038988257.1 MAR-binding filament-like protein 1 [Phoenix dactylifera]